VGHVLVVSRQVLLRLHTLEKVSNAADDLVTCAN
jgi:hypothetical protein